MLSEFQKSIKAILYDRLTSPLAGTFFFSWLVWNWGLIYYVISVDSTKSVIERIEYIKSNFLLFEYTTLYPILSTVFLIFIYPYAAIFVYKIALKFSKQKRDIKNKIDNEQCLTIEESIKIREEIEKQEENFQTMTRRRNDEIKKLKQEIELYKNKLKAKTNKEGIISTMTQRENTKMRDFEIGELKREIELYKNKLKDLKLNNNKYDNEFLKFKNTGFTEDFSRASTNIVENNHIGFEIINKSSVNYFIASELIKMISIGNYELTEKGRYFLKRLYEDQVK